MQISTENFPEEEITPKYKMFVLLIFVFCFLFYFFPITRCPPYCQPCHSKVSPLTRIVFSPLSSLFLEQKSLILDLLTFIKLFKTFDFSKSVSHVMTLGRQYDVTLHNILQYTKINMHVIMHKLYKRKFSKEKLTDLFHCISDKNHDEF